MSSPSIALGMNNGIDFEIEWDDKGVSTLVQEVGLAFEEIKKVTVVSSLRDLLTSICYQVMKGEGTSVHVTDIKYNLEFSSHFKYRTTIGGAGSRAAIVLSKLDILSYLHLVSINKETRELLPKGVKYYCGNTQDTFYPHLIIQFPKNAVITGNDWQIKSPRAKRAMYLHDPDLQTMPLSYDFFKEGGKSKVLLIGGFTTIPDIEKSLVKADEVFTLIEKFVDKDCEIYYEDSCPPHGIRPELIKVWTKIAAKVDVFGMNEDELQEHIGRKINLLDPNEVLLAIKELAELIPAKRYVIHSRYWAICYAKDASNYHDALLEATKLATTRFRLGDNISPSDLDETAKLKDDPEGGPFALEFNKLFSKDVAICVPAYEVTQDKVTTIGLGDTFVAGFLKQRADDLNK